MRLLFLKLKHIGDALLLTPTLAAVRRDYPHAEIWVGLRRGTEGILAGCPAIDHLITFTAPEVTRRSGGSEWHDLQQLRQLRAQRFDHVFELTDGDRGRWLALFSGAAVRTASRLSLKQHSLWKPFFSRQSPHDWTRGHRVEKDFYTVHHTLPLAPPIPALQFHVTALAPALTPPGQPYVILHPATRWQRKRWEESHWIEIGRYLAARGFHLVISSGPDADEVTVSHRLAQALPGAATTQGQLAWTSLAALVQGATLFIGVDTAAMHLAAAVQTPIVALFGPTQRTAWNPWQCAHRLVTPPHDCVDDPHQMAHLSVAAVKEACGAMLSPVNPRHA